METIEEIQDSFWMQKALKIAGFGVYCTSPNPNVGCVIVKNGQIISSGAHLGVGTAHAEVVALNDMKEGCEGATLYCTLEPCCHYGRTPPCVDAIVKRSIKRVVIGLEDPDIRVQGKGIQYLREHGVEVKVGILEKEIKRYLFDYLTHRIKKRPLITLKTAISLDGKLAACDGTSQWISGEESLHYAHHLRKHCQAILVGASTFAYDKPRLNVRIPSLWPQPIRLVIDLQGRIVPFLVDSSGGDVYLLTYASQAKKYEAQWRDYGARVYVIEEDSKKTFFEQLFDFLSSLGVVHLLVEGGGKTLTHFITQKYFDFWVCILAPKLIGQDGIPVFTQNLMTFSQHLSYSCCDVTSFGQDTRLIFKGFPFTLDDSYLFPWYYNYD